MAVAAAAAGYEVAVQIAPLDEIGERDDVVRLERRSLDEGAGVGGWPRAPRPSGESTLGPA